MSNIINIIEELRDAILSKRYDIGSMTKGDNIYVNNIEQAQKYIDNLCVIRRVLIDILGNIDSKLNYAIDKYRNETKLVSQLFSKIGGKHSELIDNKYIKVSNDDINAETPDLNQSHKINEIIKSLKANTEYVQITPHLRLKAIIVDAIGEVQPNGQLYYVKSINHFAFYLASRLWHGNIGNVYVSDTPKKVKTCRFGKYCLEYDNCSYYHDPVIGGGTGGDIRNFTKNSFNFEKDRLFCSRGTLEQDYKKMTPERTHEFYDCIVHEFLCAILLTQLDLGDE